MWQERALGAASTTRIQEAYLASSDQGGAGLNPAQLRSCFERLNALRPAEWAVREVTKAVLQKQPPTSGPDDVAAAGSADGKRRSCAPKGLKAAKAVAAGISFDQLLGTVSRELVQGPVASLFGVFADGDGEMSEAAFIAFAKEQQSATQEVHPAAKVILKLGPL